MLTGVTNLLFGGRITDMETCYKVMQTSIARSLQLESNRFDIEPEITAKLLRQRRRIVERPVRCDPRSRASGKKIGWRDGIAAFWHIFRYNAFPPSATDIRRKFRGPNDKRPEAGIPPASGN